MCAELLASLIQSWNSLEESYCGDGSECGASRAGGQRLGPGNPMGTWAHWSELSKVLNWGNNRGE